MAKAKVGKGPAELRPYLKRHPGTDAMELLITDVTGVFRGKRIRGNEFTKVFSDGFCARRTSMRRALKRWAW